MHLNIAKFNWLIPLSLATLITACDSGSKRVSDYPIASVVQLDESQNINQSVDLLLHYPYDKVSNIRWQQTAGEPVTVLASTSKVVSFTPLVAGEYSFSVSFSLNDGSEQTLEKTVSIVEDINKLTARLSHEVLAENKVSFRSFIQADVDLNTLSWQQTSGPQVTLTAEDSQGELAIFFDAPIVNVDTIISFNVSASDSTGVSYNDKVAVLVEPASAIGNNAYFSDRKAKTFAYNADSPYAADLVNCVYSNSLTSSCTLKQTPLLAQEAENTTAPTTKSIMDRVVVSHQWMGKRFEDFLTNNDPNNDIKNLLRATTAIVIAYDVRPSFYWAATGAIYLDAENFWLTPQERDTINEAPDFRADFGKDLQFVMPWRYVKDNDYASQSYSRLSRVERTAEDALYRLTSLMYHELAHANDFFPSYEWYSHNSNLRVLDAAISSSFESDELAITFPLTSQEMYGLAQVRFAGETATATQKAYLPIDVEGFFSPDSATDFYGYSSTREDYAMLFEELMMKNRFNIVRDVAITNQPTGDNITSSDYVVKWGQRGRIGDNKLRERVLFSASRVLPEFDSESAMEAVPAPIQMIEGDSWIDNLTISPSNENMSRKRAFSLFMLSPKTTEEERTTNFNRYYQKPLPSH